MRRSKPHFSDNNRLRSGVFYLLMLLLCLQLLIYLFSRNFNTAPDSVVRLNAEEQAWIDSVKVSRQKGRDHSLYPFNPNYFNDYRGYVLGISPNSLDRIYAYRRAGGWFTRWEELQEVGQLADSIFDSYGHLLQFPEPRPSSSDRQIVKKPIIRNLNHASAEDLKKVNGIGPVLSRRILNFRKALGGFRSGSQLYDVYGLEEEVANRVLKRFQVPDSLNHKKISLNKASAEELGQILYLRGELSRKITDYRTENGPYKSLGELERFEGITEKNIERIALYLTL
ncbi:helix-hairpin-helix domain-containing protein [Robiginitalea sp. IMCC43444]|uniref:helix-hairpin-helix domain-containing protein n=1 Tax=Robiginitalea sp. IMCC43444 TaxID=3459121 RepID=UPI00404289E5